MNRIALLVPLLAVFSIGHADEVLRPFKQDGKWGYKDPGGNVVVEPKYDEAQPFSCGLAAVNVGAKVPTFWSGPPMKTGGKWGYLDASGAVVIPIKFDFAQDFSEDLARVRVGTRPSFIDTQGRTVIDLGDLDGLNTVGDFSEGLAPVHLDFRHKGGRYETRYLDRKGKTVLTIAGYGDEFHQGLARFCEFNTKTKDALPDENAPSGFIDRQGRIVIEPTFAEVGHFSDGLAPVRLEKTEGVWGRGDRWGYIDRTGKFVIEPRFNEAHQFRNGVARAHSGGELREFSLHSPPYWDGGEWLLIDRTGKILKRSEELPDYPHAEKEPDRGRE